MKNLYILAIALLLTFVIFYLREGVPPMKDKDTEIKNPIVLLKTTMGDIKLELYSQKAPETVQNFLQYVKEGHYDKTVFHRVIDGFMVQGGGFTSNLTQKKTRPGIINEAGNGLLNKRGSVAMARTQDVNSATAQFFINVADNSFLDHRGKTPHEFGYCVFGQVIEGMDVVEKIKKVETQTRGPYSDVPATPIEITAAEVVSRN